MAEIAIHNVRDLGQDARRAPVGDERRIAAERLKESLRAMSQSAKAIPSDELESLIDEAVDDARRRPK